jgi:surfactin synthase thioesterase subunit
LVLEGRFLVCSFGDGQYMALADEREWRERLVAATERAIVQLRGHDDLTTWRLIADLDALRRRLLTQLEQEASEPPAFPGGH